jgi:unsaturated rhamnogalacturonyl hydrolase
MKDALREKIALAADATIAMMRREYENFEPDIHRWDWQPGVGLYGLVRAYEVLGEPRFLDYCRAYVDRLLEEDKPCYSVNASIMFEAVLKLYEHSNDPRYRTELRYFLRWLLRSAPKCQNDCLEHTWNEVKVKLVEQVWIDTVFMAGIVLADCSRILGREDCRDESLRQFRAHQLCLQCPETGLYHHLYEGNTDSYMAGAFWGRGNGWMAASVVDALTAVGVTDPHWEAVVDSFQRQMGAVRQLQSPNGMFHTILTDQDTYLEMSATSALGYAALRGVRLGILNGEFQSMGEQALNAVVDHIRPDGIVDRVSSGTSGFITYNEYNTIPISPRLYGQALAILLLSEYLLMLRD